MTKRTRRKLKVVPANVGELLRCDLVTFGAANLSTLSAWPDLVNRISPVWMQRSELTVPLGPPLVV
jgi:hypothetical protein